MTYCYKLIKRRTQRHSSISKPSLQLRVRPGASRDREAAQQQQQSQQSCPWGSSGCALPHLSLGS